MTVTIKLRERLDFGVAPDLKAELLAQAGNDVQMDASDVAHLGTLCLQIMIAASQDWARNGQKISLISPSEVCMTQLSLHGFTPETLTGVTS